MNIPPHKMTAWPSWIVDKKPIRRLLYRRFFRKIFGTVGPKHIIYEINGCKYYCNLLDYSGVSHFFLKNNHYEPYITELMLTHTVPEGDVLDIGANMGYFSVLCSKHTRGKVYAIEPEPNSYRHLIENIRLNQSDNIFPFKLALNQANEKIDFYINSKNSGDNRCSQFADNLLKVISVESRRLDSILTKEEFDRIRLIKIDVQGYELKVCKGMADYLNKSRDLKIISELEPKSMVQAGDRPVEYLQFMRGQGFNIFMLNEDNRTMVAASIEEVLQWSQNVPVRSIMFIK